MGSDFVFSFFSPLDSLTRARPPGYSVPRDGPPPKRSFPWLLPAVPKADIVITALDQAEDRAGDHSTEPTQPTDRSTRSGRLRPTSSLAIAVATVGGIGFAPLAPGTFGALVGVGLFLILAQMGTGLYLLTALTLTALGVWAADSAERWFGRPDDGRIVIDEVAGQLLALAPLVPLGRIEELGLRPQWTLDPDSGALIWFSLVVTAFVAFRVLDVRKPGAVGWAERRFKGGLGVMADDVVAGVWAAVVVSALTYIAIVYRLQIGGIGGIGAGLPA